MLQNNLGSFDMPMPVPASVYSVVPVAQSGQWMECDYVPIDSEEVATYNLPISSDLVKSSSMFSSFQTIILFIVFFFICVLSYFIIPGAYQALVYLCFRTYASEGGVAEKKKINAYLDFAISFVLCVPALLLVVCGVFVPNSNSNVNTGDVILSGVCIGIIYIIGYIVVQSKKLDENFIDYYDNIY
jgi:hypothetical protein